VRSVGRLLAVGTFAVVVTALPPAEANANDATGPGAGAYIDPTGAPTATAEDGDSGTVPAAAPSDCRWVVAVADDWVFGVYDPNGDRHFSESGRWRRMVCNGVLVYVDGWPLVPIGERVDVDELALRAERSLGVPDPVVMTSPSRDGLLFVRVPTWLWVDGWRTLSASASAGRVTATVEARPLRTAWSTGDGGSVSCEGPGAAWRAGMAEDASSCRHVYRRSSAGMAGDAFTLTATVEFEVVWSSNVGVGGRLGSITRSASHAVRVGEIQAVESR